MSEAGEQEKVITWGARPAQKARRRSDVGVLAPCGSISF